MLKPGSRFLVADDSVVARDIVLGALATMGQKNVDVALDGQKCLELVERSLYKGQTPYDLIILDLNLPQKDGFKVLEELRCSEKGREIPVLVITVENSKQSVIRTVMLGVTGYLVKPFGVDDVVAKISKI